MTTLFFDLANITDDYPDWSSEYKLEKRLEEKYSRLEKYASLNTKTNKFKWLKPPEDWNSTEVN
jgi:DNA repair photolyase